MKFADLHLHTLYSDGTYTPEALIKAAKKSGLSAVSVTDHDTVEGLDHVIEAAGPKEIEVIPGIELTAEHEGIEIHLLGYLIDHKNKLLKEKLEYLKNNRNDRIYKIVAKLNDIGIGLEPEVVFDMAKGGTAGRLHIARAMLKGGHVGSIYEAFDKYIGDKRPAYVCGFRFSPLEAIKLILDCEGIPVLAHPYVLGKNGLVPLFVEYGLMGLEVYYPEHTNSMIDLYLSWAQKYRLLVTGGSDCHGDAKPEVRIGSTKIPYELVEKLKEAKKARRDG